jgi:hypothetical protein
MKRFLRPSSGRVGLVLMFAAVVILAIALLTAYHPVQAAPQSVREPAAPEPAGNA